MKIVSDFPFTTISPEQKTLETFVTMLRTLYQNLAKAFNGKIGFGTGSASDNIDGVWATVVTPNTPNTDFTITHNLGRIPVGYWIMSKSAACDIYTGSTGATITQITLRATVGSVALKIFII